MPISIQIQAPSTLDWTDSDEYPGVTMRWGLEKEDRTSTGMLVEARGDEGGVFSIQ
jgi:hypothetical protein